MVLRRVALDDLYQQTVAVAMGTATKFVFFNEAKFLVWVQTIARHVIWSVVDKKRVRINETRVKGPLSSGAGVSEGDIPPAGRTPSSFVAGMEGRDRLHAAIHRLPYDYQRVITLYKLEQQSLEEVAEALGRTKGAVCRLVARAIRQLRRELGQP